MLSDDALNAVEVAALLHIGRNAVYDLAKSGELPSYRIGRKLFFSRNEVGRYLERLRREERSAAAQGAEGGNGTESHARESAESAAEAPIVIAGQGITADLLVDRMESMGLAAVRSSRTSYMGLVDLYKGRAAAAFIHLYDQRSNAYNVPYVQRLAPGTPVVVFRLVKRMQGLVVAKGNPKGLATWGGLLREGIRLANRVPGSGSRVLLDEKLIALEADPLAISGYAQEFPTGFAAAEAVACGRADVSVAGEHIARQVEGVDFVPLQAEWLDVAVAKNAGASRPARIMRRIFADERFRSEYDRIVPGDAANFGSIIYEC